MKPSWVRHFEPTLSNTIVVVFILFCSLPCRAQDPVNVCKRNDGETSNILRFTVSEDAEPGTPIGVLPFQGSAGDDNRTISLSLLEGYDDNRFVFIDEELKVLSLNVSIDIDVEESDAQWLVEVICLPLTDLDAHALSYTVYVEVEDVNDNAPQFINAPYQFSLSELSEPNTVVFTGARATDADQQRNGQVLYRVLQNPDDPESVDYFAFLSAGRPDLSLLRKLDYETKKSWEVIIEARDNPSGTPHRVTTTITVTVLDGNDVGPFFLPCVLDETNVRCEEFSYRSNVTEKMLADGPLEFWPGPIHAMDGDENVTTTEDLFFTFTGGEPANYMEYFKIDNITGNVTLLKQVRHSEITEFIITVMAREGTSADALHSSITVIISVIEINNFPPEFPSAVVYGFVQEGAELGTPIWESPSMNSALILQASDPDLEMDETFRVSYMLNDLSGSFMLSAVDQSSTRIVVNGIIDREERDSYQLMMVAMEASTRAQLTSDSITVNITVLDLNDNAPYFVENEYSLAPNKYGTTVRQNVKAGTVIMELQVADRDIAPRVNDYTYLLRLLSFFERDSPFAEMSMNSVVKIVLLVDAIEIPKGDYVLGLQASDVDNPYLLSLEVNLNIKVIGENDTEGPVFMQDEFMVFASEGTLVGSLITTVTATHSVTLPIFYTFESSSKFFSINRTTGEIRLIKLMDRETRQQHTVMVRAESAGKFDTAAVHVVVLDVNDNSPRLNSSAPSVFLIVEGQPDIFVGQISAFDPDEPGNPNSEVSFGLEDSEYFQIDPVSGVISTASEVLLVDYLERLLVEVTLHDRGTPPMSAVVTVVVIVQDVEDFSPVFEYAEYNVDIQENYKADNFLNLRVLSRNQTAEYQFILLEGNEEIFSLNNETGAISLISTLDYEGKDSFYLEVAVIDQWNGTDITNVTITVRDENDNAPQFNQSVYEGVYDPVSPAGTVVVRNIEAYDLDQQGTENSRLIYHIEPSFGIFQLSSDQSSPVIITSVHLNFTQETFVLNVIAVDNGEPPLSSTAEVIIRPRITQPIFDENPIRVTSLFEGEPPDSLVTTIKARANIGDVVTYSIISGNINNVFFVTSEDNMGYIYTSRELDRELQSLYVLQVLAEIQNSQTVRRRKRNIDPSIAMVMIEVGDVNDNPPTFTQDVYYAGVSQTATEGSLVTKLSTTDLDAQRGDVLYKLSGSSQSSSKFRILERSGIVITTESFSSDESDLTFRLNVGAEDESSEQLQMTSTLLLVSVINSTNRIIISVNMSTDAVDEQRERLQAELSMLFSAHAFVEDVIQRRTGQDYQEIDPSGSDILIFVLEDVTGRPWQNNDTIGMLFSRREQLDDISLRLLPQGTILEIRIPADVDFGMVVVTRPYAPEGILLIIIAVIIFVLTIMACFIILISWKKREMEREENRIYLPMQYSTFNPYKQSTEDLEISNPVFFEGQDNNSLNMEPTSPVEMYPNGSATHIRDREVQEYAIEFGPEDDEATAVAKSVIQSGVLDVVPDEDSNVPGDSTPPLRIEPADYQHSTSQEPLITPESPDGDLPRDDDLPLPPPPDFSLPHVPEQPSRRAPSPPLRDYSNHGTLPADTVLPTYKAYDNPGMNLSDEEEAAQNATPENKEENVGDEDDEFTRVPVSGTYDPTTPQPGQVDTDDLHVALIRISQSDEDISKNANPNPMSTFKEPLDAATRENSPKIENSYVHVVTPAPFRLHREAGNSQSGVFSSQDTPGQDFQTTEGSDHEEPPEGASSLNESEDEVRSTKF